LLWERGPVWKQYRLRFTVAHEIGQWVLHRDYAASVKFTSFDHFARHFKGDDPGRYWLEQEANEFAGRLLVPVERLRELFDQFAGRSPPSCPTCFSRRIYGTSSPSKWRRGLASTNSPCSPGWTGKACRQHPDFGTHEYAAARANAAGGQDKDRQTATVWRVCRLTLSGPELERPALIR
jgi:hypothetical protein